eukprot:1204243-Lingulodinium_polyedra.AAC.1
MLGPTGPAPLVGDSASVGSAANKSSKVRGATVHAAIGALARSAASSDTETQLQELVGVLRQRPDLLQTCRGVVKK